MITASTIKELLYQATAQAVNDAPADAEAEVLQSTIGMIHTLIDNGQLAQLTLLLSVNFAAYYPADWIVPLLELYPKRGDN